MVLKWPCVFMKSILHYWGFVYTLHLNTQIIKSSYMLIKLVKIYVWFFFKFLFIRLCTSNIQRFISLLSCVCFFIKKKFIHTHTLRQPPVLKQTGHGLPFHTSLQQIQITYKKETGRKLSVLDILINATYWNMYWNKSENPRW